MRRVFFWVVPYLALGCFQIPDLQADPAQSDVTIVTAESVEREQPTLPAEADAPDLSDLTRVDIPPGWTLQNEGGDSALLSHADGSSAIVLLMSDGVAGHVAFRQDEMDCVAAFEARFSRNEGSSETMFMAAETLPNGMLEVRYFLVDWPPAAAASLHDMFLPEARHAVCAR